MDPNYLSWGRYFRYNHQVERPEWLSDDFSFMQKTDKSMLAFGYGRSYGDSCLNDDGLLIDTKLLDRLISLDKETGIIRCEAGVSLAQILEVAIPNGWFLGVTPGTKFVSVGGAIANDVHGKNHHKVGTFGRFVERFELLRSDGERLICSPTENAELFSATIGGLGLTGLILWADIALKKKSAIINMQSIKFKNLDEFFRISNEDDEYEHTVAWVDCVATGGNLGRGIYMRGNHSTKIDPKVKIASTPKLGIPFDAPNFLLNELTVKAFNFLYYNQQRKDFVEKSVNYDPFFYPLDVVNNWNRIYGNKGFFQYQLVVPLSKTDALIKIFETISTSGLASFLAILKRNGPLASPGMISFPKEGYTLALDFVNRGDKTLDLFKRLDDILGEADGRIYPAKDSAMSAAAFQSYYPRWQELAKYKDPKFSSSFWRRVTGNV